MLIRLPSASPTQPSMTPDDIFESCWDPFLSEIPKFKFYDFKLFLKGMWSFQDIQLRFQFEILHCWCRKQSNFQPKL